VQGNTWCCVGDYGRVMWTTDGGVTWTTPPAVSQNFARFWGVQFPDPNHGFIVGDGGDLYRTTNGGKTWSKQIISTHHALLALSFLDGNTGTIVGESGTVLRYAGRDSLRSSTPDTVDTGGHDSTIVTPKVIDHFALEQNYPNPFNPTTTIVYDVPTAELVSLKIYDVLGREVAILVNEIKAPGRYAAVFNAAGYSSGMYIYRFSAGSFTQSKRMLYLK
jgi:hypothetical protein